MIPTLLRHRELALRLVKRDLRVRYKSSALGFFWSVAKPLLLVAVYSFVFDTVLDVDPPVEGMPYSLFIMAGLLPWVYFASSLGESMHVILGNANLIKKVKLPQEVFPVAVVLGNLAHFLLALLVLFAFMAWRGIELGWPALWLLVLIPLQTILIVGLALLFSSLNVFYRDIASAFEVIFTAWMYGTPIVYSLPLAAGAFGLGGEPSTMTLRTTAGTLPPWLFDLYMLNPLTPLVLAYRRVLLYASPFGSASTPPRSEYAGIGGAHPDLWLVQWVGVSALLAIAVFILGTAVFRRLSKRFADEI